jgi:hypothetical protein
VEVETSRQGAEPAKEPRNVDREGPKTKVQATAAEPPIATPPRPSTAALSSAAASAVPASQEKQSGPAGRAEKTAVPTGADMVPSAGSKTPAPNATAVRPSAPLTLDPLAALAALSDEEKIALFS